MKTPCQDYESPDYDWKPEYDSIYPCGPRALALTIIASLLEDMRIDNWTDEAYLVPSTKSVFQIAQSVTLSALRAMTTALEAETGELEI
jgi:hypothetical protein